ncbi:MAG: 2-oxoacid:acceptor oxidoreductase subunit alpha [Dehalococcoidia bacterium]|nr:2-oxoacid:acceptor oxidoreductase subunit alpha [Dehalococcoidia bacterium]
MQQKQHQDFVVRFAGEGGQGVVTAAEMLAQAASQFGYHIQTFATFPSQILGGPTWTQARVSTTRVLSPGDELDILVAFNKEAYDNHRAAVGPLGVVVYDSAQFTPTSDGQAIGLAFDELARKTGNTRAANMVVLGALTRLVGWDTSFLEQFITKRFSRGRAGDEEIIKANIQALHLGRGGTSVSKLQIGKLAPPQKPPYPQILLKGNEAISLGAMHAGVEVYVGYPISPATPILIFMERNLIGPGKFAYQSSSEIESINALVGAGYAGKKAMTGTAGPGFSLMHEGIGLAWMAEIPLVIANVQRGGPATGLPTKTEQSDLLSAMHPAHGDVSLPVLAPGSVEECFYATVQAFNWAERYQGPVVILSEMMLAERSENIRKPDLDKLLVENRKVYQGDNGYQRYADNKLSPMPLPGGPGAYVANASEHDSIGDTTHLAERHVQMTERRFSKLKLLESANYESKHPEHAIAVMPWGGSKGPAAEAYQRLEASGLPVGWYYTMELNPLPPKLIEELRTKELVLVPELNYLGQFASVLRSNGIRAEAITQYTGLPFKVRDLVRRITERIETVQNKKVKA